VFFFFFGLRGVYCVYSKNSGQLVETEI